MLTIAYADARDNFNCTIFSGAQSPIDTPDITGYTFYIPPSGGYGLSNLAETRAIMSIETNRTREPEQRIDEGTGTRQTTLAIEGMSCASCSMHVENGLKKLPGVKNAEVNLATERGIVTYDPRQVEVSALLQKVEEVGYKAIQEIGRAHV